MITSLGFAVLTEDSIAHLGHLQRDIRVVDQWAYHTRLYESAAKVINEDCLDMIRNRGKRAGLSIKPGTPAEVVYPYLEKCDMILVMTVEPGYGGQALIPETLDKVRAIRAYISERGYDIDIQVDGGIKPENAKAAIEAGANILVAGSSVFKAQDRRAAVDALR
jgi:ribulose-phosphate 3-epimerase